ncbi:MAG TPA: hypothetical protein VF737_04870 [Gemmatimonadaceae bacterium]
MMLASMARGSAWLLQAVATLPDTVFTRQIVERGWFDQLAHVASGVLAILLLLLVLLVFPAAWYVRNRLKQLTAVIDGLRHDFGPVVERTRGVMQNAEEISATVRRDVERLSETVEQFDGQLREIADIAGDRVRDFDALLGAVQQEVEDVFLTTASAARGIRAGVRALRRHRSRRDREVELRASRRAAEAEEEYDEEEELPAPVDGGDDEPRDRAPRLRRRRRAT